MRREREMNTVYISFCSVRPNRQASLSDVFVERLYILAMRRYDSFSSLDRLKMADSTTISFTKSNRGKPMLVRLGYVYRLKKSTTKVKYWVCQSASCTAGIHTDKNDEFIKPTGQHRHLSTPEHVELRDLKINVKNRIQDETVSVPKVYVEELARSNLSSTALTLAPSSVEASEFFVLFYCGNIFCCIESGLNRVRRKLTPPLPKSMNFDIPDSYRQTLNNDRFICADKTTKNKRIIIFATDRQLEMLFESEWIFLDGTFDSCPSQFKQLYTIHALKFNQSK